MNSTRWLRLDHRCALLLALGLLALLAPACSLVEPESPVRGHAPLLDGESADRAVRLLWNSHREPSPDWPYTPVVQPKSVLVSISEDGPTKGYRLLANRPGGIIDSLIVPGLVNGRAYYFRATVFAADDLPYFTSDPIVVMPGVESRPILSFELGRYSAETSAPAWSPDGTAIAFARRDGPRPSLRVLDLGTRIERGVNIEPSEYVSDPAWSPGGTQISYTSSPSRTAGTIDYRIWSTDVAGSSWRSLTPGRVDFGSAWGATDSVLVFCRGSSGGRNIAEIYRLDPRTPDSVIAVTRDQRLNKRYPSVRRSDHRVVFMGTTGSNVGLYVVPLAGGAIQPLLTSDWWEESAPAWSPDGRHIAFTSTRSGHPDIWVLDATTRTVRQITTGRHPRILDRFAGWSPDGTRLAVRERTMDGEDRLNIHAVP